MPLYQITCNKCGKMFDRMIGIKNFDAFKAGEYAIQCEDNATAECIAPDVQIKITGLRTRHKSWWNWRSTL